MLKRLSIKLKLLILAGVPVLGALMLATWIARDAIAEAESTAALGSIEDLAHLSAQISTLVHELQFERNEAGLELAEHTDDSRAYKDRIANTDRAEKQLASFLEKRRLSELPPRLARDLKLADTQIKGLPALREAVLAGKQDVTLAFEHYERTNQSLIRATAALSQLSDDGELMRAISALVGVLEIKERASQEHAVLSHVFSAKTFPPGMYKELVTLITEEADYINALELHATDAVMKRFRAEEQRPEFQRAADIRKVALNTLDEDFGVEAREWSELQAKRINGLRSLEGELNDAVQDAAVAKVSAAAASVRLSYGLGAGVVVISSLLAGLIARGVSRSVGSLAASAQRVRTEKDFSVRAEHTSDDELGALTTAFNEMLSGIQERDQELERHRNNLERLVEERTLELQKRNEAMRLVLDNVEQGLVTIERDGTMSAERSRAFDAWFGATGSQERFGDRLAGANENLRAAFEMGWEQVVEEFMPVEVSLDQMPKRIAVEGRHYELEYKPILTHAEEIPASASAASQTFQGVLLVITDVTAEIARMKEDANQRELIAVFQRIMDDRSAFFQFMKECEGLVTTLSSGSVTDIRLLMRAAHTLKGNCGSFGVTSVADAAHHLESGIIEQSVLPAEELREVQQAWSSFKDRVHRLSGSPEDPTAEVTHEELDQAIAFIARGGSAAELSGRLERWKDERLIVRLRRASEQARGLAKRLGRGEIAVDIRASKDLRLPEARWAPFWSAFIHVLRNAIDHGLEPADERVRAGKDAQGRLQLSAQLDGKDLVIELSDDGRGIDWMRVRERAAARGLPYATEQDLTDALFADGLTTKDQVTDISGRGVGLAAVREATRALSGQIAVTSRLGQGTTFVFRFPSAAKDRSGFVVASRHAISQ